MRLITASDSDDSAKEGDWQNKQQEENGMKRKLLAFVLVGTMIAHNGLLTYASDLVVQSDTEVSDFVSEETVSDVQEETAEPED